MNSIFSVFLLDSKDASDEARDGSRDCGSSPVFEELVALLDRRKDKQTA